MLRLRRLLGRRLQDLQRSDLKGLLRQCRRGNGGGILRVIAQMLLQIRARRVRLGTQPALVRTETRMYGHVPIQIRLLRKRFHALSRQKNNSRKLLQRLFGFELNYTTDERVPLSPARICRVEFRREFEYVFPNRSFERKIWGIPCSGRASE